MVAETLFSSVHQPSSLPYTRHSCHSTRLELHRERDIITPPESQFEVQAIKLPLSATRELMAMLTVVLFSEYFNGLITVGVTVIDSGVQPQGIVFQAEDKIFKQVSWGEDSYGILDKKPQEYRVKNKVASLAEDNSSDVPLSVCPGQRFQIVYLKSHLQDSLFSGNDLLLNPYLASWDELIKFLEALGPIVGIISQEIVSKTAIIRDLAEKADTEAKKKWTQRTELTNGSKVDQMLPNGYSSIRSMIIWELEKGVVDFQKQTGSGCRTLLRLHRALLWLHNFLQELGREEDVKGNLRKPSDLCRETYQRTLARHHSWLVRRAAELAFLAIPERPYFYKLVCVKTQAEMSVVLNKVVRAIELVYVRTETALQEHGMLDLP
ncbi:hypothetical protein DNTS_017701 [Danionella cerebrum]|uniref:Glycolipid transfer protein domain-containing protein n=1 Tax=Danionella cerebrum TaxID=2873325 RepID=A0A553RQD2_9TELE|nr:hypothetical protein DNTS_017701 [Danionella translucida]